VLPEIDMQCNATPRSFIPRQWTDKLMIPRHVLDPSDNVWLAATPNPNPKPKNIRYRRPNGPNCF
jgi:hypothetical protein